MGEAIRVAKVLNCPYLMLLTDQLEEGGIVENSYPELTLQEKYHNTITSLKKAIVLSVSNTHRLWTPMNP